MSAILGRLKALKILRASIAPVRVRAGKFGSLDEFCTRCGREQASGSPSRTLDLGCGENPKNPFQADESFGIDIRGNERLKTVKCADLAVEPIPFPEGYFDFVTAFDFLEHVPRILYLPARRFPFVEVMNEIYRVLKTNGVLLSHTPAYPYAPAFRDPTHVNIITRGDFSLLLR